MDRREFIKKSFLIGAGFSFLSSMPFSAHPSVPRSRVVQISHSNVQKGRHFRQDVLTEMLNRGLANLYSTEHPDQVWKQLFSSRDVVGIKVNCLSGKHGSSHRELVDVIIEQLQRAGVSPGNIIIWDRLNADLENAGFQINWKDRSKPLCFGNDVAGYDDRLYLNGSVGSLITRTVTHLTTAIINIPVLKDHGIVGVTLSMKNFFGAIHNPNKYHLNAGNPYVADLYQMEIIRSKVRLIVCDALVAQYEGGPPFKPQWSWPMNSLLLAVDGVALDRVGWEIIERKRREKQFPSLKKAGREPVYILTAGEKGLGESDLNKIDWQTLAL